MVFRAILKTHVFLKLQWKHFHSLTYSLSIHQYSILWSWLFLSVFSCMAAGSNGRFRSPIRRWRDERNWTEFLFVPYIPSPPFSPPPAAPERSFLLLFSCLRLLMTKVCCLCVGKEGGLDPFTRSPGAPGLVNPIHVIFLALTSFGPTLHRRGNGAEGDVWVLSTVPRWSRSEGWLSASGSILGETPFFSEE